jgi:hypothetical protein
MTKEREEKSELTLALEPDKVTPRHRALMRRLVSGMTLTQACEDLGFTVSRASIIVHSPLFQAEMQRMESDLRVGFVEAESDKIVNSGDETKKLLMETAEMAARTLKGALSDDNATIRVSAAKDILDRAGYAKEDKLKAKVTVEPSQALVDVIGRICAERVGSNVGTE